MDDDVVEKVHTSDSVEVEDVELPEELVQDEADREMLLQMTEVEREFELEKRSEKQRRESERQKFLEKAEESTDVKGTTTFLGKRPIQTRAVADEDTSDEDFTFASQTGTPTAHREQGKPAAETLSEKETEDSDTGDKEAVENEADFTDYLSAQIFRKDLERWITEPHFDESVLGCFVRFRGSQATNKELNRNEYLMVEVTNCETKEDIQPYKFGQGNKMTKVQLLLKRGGTEFWSGIDVISNSKFEVKEYEDWVQSCKRHKRPLHSKVELEDRKEQIHQARRFVFTHVEVKKILDEKRKQGSLKVSNVMQRAHFMRLRDYYLDRNDTTLVEEYERKIKALEDKADAQRRSLSLGVIDKQAAALKRKMKVESLESWIEHRRPRVMEKFAKKLERMPAERRPKAILEFYGPSDPRCANIRESDVKRPFLEKSPSPDLDPPLPDEILNQPNLHRDFSHSAVTGSLTAGLKQLADWARATNPDAAVCQQFLNRWQDDAEAQQREIKAKITRGELHVRSWDER